MRALELRRAAVVVGLSGYVDQVRHLLRPGTEILASGLEDLDQERGRLVQRTVRSQRWFGARDPCRDRTAEARRSPHAS